MAMAMAMVASPPPLEAPGVSLVLSLSADEAFSTMQTRKFDPIMSDMDRNPDQIAFTRTLVEAS
jgi:hypothetical protein